MSPLAQSLSQLGYSLIVIGTIALVIWAVRTR